jgi:hypothetical protein
MNLFYCLVIIMTYNIILSNVCLLFVQLPLLFIIIRVNPDYFPPPPQIVRIYEVLLYKAFSQSVSYVVESPKLYSLNQKLPKGSLCYSSIFAVQC